MERPRRQLRGTFSAVGVAARRHDRTADCMRPLLSAEHPARSCRFPLYFSPPRPSGDKEALQHRANTTALGHRNTALSGGGNVTRPHQAA
eukprot:2009805-Prymnesium_polylepis.1